MKRGAGSDPNLELLSTMVDLLGDIADELVFVGGCATGLFITSMRAQTVRVTWDVDVVAEAATLREYHAIEARLRKKGFRHDPEIVCRWTVQALQLDLLPSAPGVLGFHNRWYPKALATAQSRRLPSGRVIRLVTSPLFLATKLEAFLDRGQGDYLVSHDLEDIITVVDGRESLLNEVEAVDADVRTYIRERITALLRDEDFLTAVPGYLPGDVVSQARLPNVMDVLKRLAGERS